MTVQHIASHHIASHDSTSHHVTWHHITSRTSHRITSHPITYSTSLGITWHDVTSSKQPHYLSSRHNQPHYFISPRNHHIIPRHITSQRIASPPRTRQGNTTSHHQNTTTKGNGCRLVHAKIRFGQRTGWWPGAHSMGKFFLCLMGSFSSFPLKLPPRACLGTTGCFT